MIIHKIPRQLRGNEYRQKKENLDEQSSQRVSIEVLT